MSNSSDKFRGTVLRQRHDGLYEPCEADSDGAMLAILFRIEGDNPSVVIAYGAYDHHDTVETCGSAIFADGQERFAIVVAIKALEQVVHKVLDAVTLRGLLSRN